MRVNQISSGFSVVAQNRQCPKMQYASFKKKQAPQKGDWMVNLWKGLCGAWIKVSEALQGWSGASL